MANIIEITDLTVPGVQVFSGLTEAQLRSRIEPEKGVFIAESPKVINVALDCGYIPRALLMERRQIDGQGRDIICRCGDIPVYTGSRQVLAELTGYSLTRGILCAMSRPALPSVQDVCLGASRIAVLEGIVDSTNTGAIFRSAAALGIDGILVAPNCCDPFNRRSIRVSMGTVFQIPWTYACGSLEQWQTGGIQVIRELGFKTTAMALSSDAVSIDDERLASEPRLAIVLGAEGDGLSHHTISGCDYTVCIPMSHNVDSLNVAAASAVAFWQLRRR